MILSKRILFCGFLGMTTALPAFAGAELDFSDRPSYMPQDALSLTFDDGPDWVNTAQILDILRDKNVKATFFINGDNYSNINAEEPMRELVRRIVREGHTLGNHTVHHYHLPELSDQDIENEIAGLENSVRSIFGGGGPALTLLRAPHGEPFQDRGWGIERVSTIVARHAVHVGWNVDSLDYECGDGDGNCVYNNVMNRIQWPGSGAYGVVLLHSVHSQTVRALPGMIDAMRARGFHFWSVEDAVRARYGHSSGELVGGNPPPANGPQAGRTYSLVSRHSGKCMDVLGFSQDPTTRIIQWDCTGNVNQRFLLSDAGDGSYTLRAEHSGQCVDMDAWSQNNGADVIQWYCHGGANQRVYLNPTGDGWYSVRFAHSNKCLDVRDWNTENRGSLQQWDCTSGANQQWSFRP